MDFTKQKLPPIYHKAGRECYLDQIRKRLTYITPEETVRQQIISYLIEELKVPIEVIESEAVLKHYGIDVSGRADIVIHKMTEIGQIPLCVIECKAPIVGIDNKVEQQVIKYADELACDYMVISNGIDTRTYFYDEKLNLYNQISKLPEYESLVNGEFELLEFEQPPERIKFELLQNHVEEEKTYDDNYVIGNSTEIGKAMLSFNLFECLLDVRVKVPLKKFNLFSIIEDLGVRLSSYGNAGGGVFYGIYRAFLIDFNGENQIVSFTVSTYSSGDGYSDTKTTLNVAIDTDKAQHHALQLVIDDNVECINDEYMFYHSGRIAVGNIGSGKVSELKELIAEYYPTILKNDRICLGKLKNDKLFQLTDESVIELIENLVSYSLVRDIYREQVKEHRAKSMTKTKVKTIKPLKQKPLIKSNILKNS